MNARAYPLPRPADDDPRFNIALHLEVARVLTEQGFPKLSGVDLVSLGQALFRFLYAAEEQPTQTAQTQTEHDADATTVHPDPTVEAARQKWLAVRQKTRDAYAVFQSAPSSIESERARGVWMAAIQVSNEARWAFEHAREDAEKGPAALDDSAPTFAEYRAAIPYWQRRLARARVDGSLAEVERCIRCIRMLQERVTRAEVVAQRGDWHPDLSDEQLTMLKLPMSQGAGR